MEEEEVGQRKRRTMQHDPKQTINCIIIQINSYKILGFEKGEKRKEKKIKYLLASYRIVLFRVVFLFIYLWRWCAARSSSSWCSFSSRSCRISWLDLIWAFLVAEILYMMKAEIPHPTAKYMRSLLEGIADFLKDFRSSELDAVWNFGFPMATARFKSWPEAADVLVEEAALLWKVLRIGAEKSWNTERLAFISDYCCL